MSGANFNSVCQSVHGDIQRQLLTVFGANALAIITSVVGTESATEAVLTHHSDEIALVEQAFELNIPWLVKATNAIDVIK